MKDKNDEEFFKTQMKRMYTENNENIFHDPEIKKLKKMQKNISPEMNLLWSIEVLLDRYRELLMSDNHTRSG